MLKIELSNTISNRTNQEVDQTAVKGVCDIILYDFVSYSKHHLARVSQLLSHVTLATTCMVQLT